jgi:oligopeptidase B
MWLVGYGSYGYDLPVTFSGSRLSLDRGVVVGIAHIRGGGGWAEVATTAG